MLFYYKLLFSTMLLCCVTLKLSIRNTLHYCGIAMEISSERNAHLGDTDLRVERIRNSADCEQVLDKKPLSHDKLNIELWGLAKLRTIQSSIHAFWTEILKESDYKKGVARMLYKGMESIKEFINICMAFIGSKCMFIHMFSFHEEPRAQMRHKDKTMKKH